MSLFVHLHVFSLFSLFPFSIFSWVHPFVSQRRPLFSIHLSILMHSEASVCFSVDISCVFMVTLFSFNVSSRQLLDIKRKSIFCVSFLIFALDCGHFVYICSDFFKNMSSFLFFLIWFSQCVKFCLCFRHFNLLASVSKFLSVHLVEAFSIKL